MEGSLIVVLQKPLTVYKKEKRVKIHVVLYVEAITTMYRVYRKAKNFIAFSLRTDNIDPFTDMLSTYKEGFINSYIIHTE